MSIQYLNTSTQMKIRPVSDEDVLFEMETNEFMTTCCRVNTSYDLVVRDITSGAMLFCISGAEIEDHPLDVYISDNHHIGKIEGMDIYVHGQNTQFVSIERNEIHYQLQESTVTATAGLITLNWSTDFSVELKALSIAFALNIAMTKHKATIIDGADVVSLASQTERNQPPLLPSGEGEASPKHNRHSIPSIFTPCSVKQEFWLRSAGCLDNNLLVSAVLMNKTNKQVVLYVWYQYHKTTKMATYKALHPDRKDEYTATWTLVDHENICYVNYKRQDIGKITFNWRTKEIKINCNEENTTKEIYTITRRSHNVNYKKFVDDNGRHYGTFNNYFPQTLDIELAAEVCPVVKMLIICASSHFYLLWLKMSQRLPKFRLVHLMCNCDYCQRPCTTQRLRYLTTGYLFTKDTILVKPAGHNTIKNLIYFTVYPLDGGAVDWTLEVTPIQKFEGVAKIEGRNPIGSIIFTSIFYQQDVIAIYDWNNQLVAYIEKENVWDCERDLIFAIKHVKLHKSYKAARFGPNLKFILNGVREKTKSAISHTSSLMTIYRFAKSKPSLLQVLVELTLTVKVHSEVYGYDKLPVPEIVYCYRRTPNMKINDIFI